MCSWTWWALGLRKRDSLPTDTKLDPAIAVATGNLLDLEETAKAPLSTVSANTVHAGDAPRPQALSSSGVIWVSGLGTPQGPWEPGPGPWTSLRLLRIQALA